MKRCTVVCDTPIGFLSCELQLPDDATIDTALAAARVQLGDEAADWERGATGVYGKVRQRGYLWVDADRIELYRPLQLDPKARRRERARRKAL